MRMRRAGEKYGRAKRKMGNGGDELRYPPSSATLPKCLTEVSMFEKEDWRENEKDMFAWGL
jgi:hypothetical protein